MRALTILVVEDDLPLRLFYELALLEQGHAVNAVSNGVEALDALSGEIDLVVTDLSMPVMSGNRLIATLRANPEYRELPVLVVTAYPADLPTGLRIGKTAVLRKPFELEDFVRWVDATASQVTSRN